MKRNRDFGLSIGAPSIVVIMVILCLVCFAGLSIVSANADLTLSRKLAERTSAYYQAGGSFGGIKKRAFGRLFFL